MIRLLVKKSAGNNIGRRKLAMMLQLLGKKTRDLAEV